MIAPPRILLPQALLCLDSVLPVRVMSVLFTTSAVPLLPWKEQLTSSVHCVDCKSRAAYTGIRGKSGTLIVYLKSLLQEVKSKEYILNSTKLVKRRPTDPLQTTVALLPEEDSPHMVNLVTLETVIFVGGKVQFSFLCILRECGAVG